MTTTQIGQFTFVGAGKAYTGGRRWEVYLNPHRERLGVIAKSSGKRGSTWIALAEGQTRSRSGFSSREAAAKWLLEQR